MTRTISRLGVVVWLGASMAATPPDAPWPKPR